MKPQLIRLRSPRPRKDRDDSVRMAVATMNEADTMMGDMALGRIWVPTMRAGVWPMTIAAWTNSRCLSVMNSERTSRAAGGQDTTAIAPMMEYTDGLRMATSTTAIANCGMVWKNSVKRISASSTRPPQ
ncbi:hypothetical protein D3C73_1184220 [compost metagenome]